MPLAERLHAGQVARRRHREAVRRGNGLEQHRRDLVPLERSLHGVEIVERHLHELAGSALREEEAREAFVAGGEREPVWPW